MSGTEQQTIVPLGLGADGRPVATTMLTPATNTTECVVLAGPTAVIPIIFLPGIMGTNLKSKGGAKGGAKKDVQVWRPPNMDGVGPALGAIGQLFSYWFRGPATRQRRLDPHNVEVDERGPIDTEGAVDEKTARKRGWGTVMRSAYQPVMSQMERRLNNIMESCELLDWWNEEALRNPADYGEETGSAPLTLDEIKQAARYRYEVWGGGYNWLQSNRDSGADIIRYVEDVVLAHYARLGIAAEKVILVTHSMGGLVGRSVACLHGYDKLLGVVHGVMPATGAPATYHHCRCGYDGISQVILGRDAAEVTAVMANSPGALELVPTRDYNGGKPWLKLGGRNDESAQWLPKADPYEEIYKSREWYGLVPQHHEGLLDPAKTNVGDRQFSDFERLNVKLDLVQEFHGAIEGRYPSPAFVHYGDDSVRRSWATVHWQGATLAAQMALSLDRDDGEGTLQLRTPAGTPVELKFGAAADAGDGTVPTTSGAAPVGAVEAAFRQGDRANGMRAKINGKGNEAGYEHQGSYQDVRTHWATLFGVVKLAQGATW